jgi:hypothetical protein
LGDSIPRAPCGHICHHTLKAPQIPYLAANFGHVLQSQRTDFFARIFVPVDEPEETTKLFEAEAEFPAASYEAKAFNVVWPIDTVSAGGAARHRHDADLLVVPDCLDIDAALFRQLPDR